MLVIKYKHMNIVEKYRGTYLVIWLHVLLTMSMYFCKENMCLQKMHTQSYTKISYRVVLPNSYLSGYVVEIYI